MSKHIHAELMAQYAQDAMETDTPWELWEVDVDGDEYGDYRWSSLSTHPAWNLKRKYRRKPRTININGHEVPEPVREPLNGVTKYFTPDVKYPELNDCYSWEGTVYDLYRLNSGMLHLTKEAAIAHARALLSFTAKPEVSDE